MIGLRPARGVLWGLNHLITSAVGWVNEKEKPRAYRMDLSAVNTLSLADCRLALQKCIASLSLPIPISKLFLMMRLTLLGESSTLPPKKRQAIAAV